MSRQGHSLWSARAAQEYAPAYRESVSGTPAQRAAHEELSALRAELARIAEERDQLAARVSELDGMGLMELRAELSALRAELARVAEERDQARDLAERVAAAHAKGKGKP